MVGRVDVFYPFVFLVFSCFYPFAEAASIGDGVSASGSRGAPLGSLDGDGRSPGVADVSGERSPLGRRRGSKGNAAQGETVALLFASI